MTLKTFLKLLFHAMITFLIIITVPLVETIVLYNYLPNWALVVIGAVTGIIAMYPALNYMYYVVAKKDIFKDMF